MNIKELHSIMPIANIPSVMKHGILSHNLRKRKRIPNHSIAMSDVQDRRKKKIVKGGRYLHDYANLHFDAHNPMLSRRRDMNNEICVLRISPEVLNLPEVVITDQNAASKYVKFLPSPEGLEILDFDLIYAENWKHPNNQITEWQHSSTKCAEVLVPDCVEPQYIIGAYVCNRRAEKALKDVGFSGKITIKDSGLFF